MKPIAFAILLSLFSSCQAQNNYDEQIKMAVLAAPEAAREGAHVFGYDKDGNFITLREGTNDYIVRSDNPNQEGFEVVCYMRDAEPFMARGRELRKQGKDRGEVLKMREDEAAAGTLPMPNYGSTLNIYYGDSAHYNAETDQLEGGSFRYVIYTPLATAESTGLPLRPNGPGHPWVMFPGLYRAHIMITPPEGN